VAETKAEPSHSMPVYLTLPILAIRGDYAAAPLSSSRPIVLSNVHRITRVALMPGDRLEVGRRNFTVQYELQE